MTEFELLGPRAYGASCGQAVLKATAEDFQVDEVLDIPLSGAGEHLWLWVEKRQLNTEEAARRIAKAAGVPLRNVGYAGLKDRQALTRQWFSVHLPGKSDPDLAGAASDQLCILKQQRHSRKLQRGAHSANGFSIRLTQCSATQEQINARCALLAQQGVPNYFGAQRFGFEGNNVHQALDLAEQAIFPEQRSVRSRLISATRSYLFNRILAQRVSQGDWNVALAGDYLSFTDSHSFFKASADDCQDPRLQALDLHPTGALCGEQNPQNSYLPHELTVRACYPALASWLDLAGLSHERRILRLPVRDLTWHYPEPDILQLNFVLPTGCFATAVVRELVDLVGQTDISCAF